MRKILSIVLCALLTIGSLAFPVFADMSIYVNEPATFTSSSESGSSSGSGYVDTRTDEQKAADAQNYALLNAYTQRTESMMDELGFRFPDWQIQTPGGYTFVTDMSLPRSQLEKVYLNNGAAYEFNTGGTSYYYSTRHQRSRQSNMSLAGKENAADKLHEVVENQGLLSHNPQTALSVGQLGQPDASYTSQMIGYGAIPYASILGYQMLDFSTYQGRLDGVQQFASIWGEDLINTRYILEIKAESYAVRQIATRTPVDFYPGFAFWWKFENISPASSGNTSAIAPITGYGGNTITQRFPTAGRYHAQAAQQILYTYTDALTITVNEYWVIAETGQIIYCREQTGGRINPNSPLANQTLNNLYYPYSYYEDETCIETTYSEYFTVVDSFITDGSTPGFRRTGFVTERIK